MASYDCSVPLPSSLDSEYIQPSHYSTPPYSVFPQSSFFTESIKLYRILGSILSVVYESKSLRVSGDLESLQSAHSFDAVLDLDNSLTRFHADLPPELRWDKADGDFEASNRRKWQSQELEVNVLHARFCPSMNQVSNNTNKPSLSGSFICAFCFTALYSHNCVKVSPSIVWLHDERETVWDSIRKTRRCGLILLFAVLRHAFVHQ
jgi:hypothetical protein